MLSAAAVSLAGLLYERAAERRDRGRFPPPGRMVPVAGTLLHIHDSGGPGISIVLESGIAGPSVAWFTVAELLAPFARVVRYDRAGLGWSGPPRTPRTPSNLAGELRDLLQQAAVPAPYLLVAHSFGGLIARQFALAYPELTQGVVFADALPAVPRISSRMLRRSIRLLRCAAFLARFGLLRPLLAKRAFLARLLGTAMGGRTKRWIEEARFEFNKLPPEALPALFAQWANPEFYRTVALTLEAIPQFPPGVLPVPAIALCSDYDSAQGHPGARYQRIENSGHWIQLDQPGAIIQAVRTCHNAHEGV
ncbi:MAG: alpha/beta hydrolase [Acidobacteriota bacterium]|nr:alpha/beta hydrolase [Acidobacteriota bacterium]